MQTRQYYENRDFTESAYPAPDYGHFQDRRNNEMTRSEESLDSTGKTKSFGRLVERFAEKTSMQGVPYINSAKVWYAKLLWTVLLIACTAGMTLHLYYLISQFLEWPILTKIELGFDNLYFPSVTVCNVNPIRKSELYRASEEIKTLIEEMDSFFPSDVPTDEPTTEEPTGRRKRFVDEFSDINITDDYYYYYYYDDYEYEDFKFGSEEDGRIKSLNRFRHLYINESRDDKVDMGHQLEDMMLSCTLGKYKCFVDNFTLHQHHIYGNCFTFKPGNLKISQPGPDHGLSLIFYLDKENYLKSISDGYGVRIQVHESNTYPYPHLEGMFVPSMTETQITLRSVVISRQSLPYNNCTEEIYLQKYGFRYTRALCQELCSQESFYKTCGCYEETVSELYYQIKTQEKDKFCSTKSEIKCMLKERARQDLNKAECKCHNPCTENQYVKTVTSRNWPTEDYMGLLREGVCDRLPGKCMQANEDLQQSELFRRGLNYVKINIFFEDLNYERITENPEIETAQFASDFGGAVGLWIGLSFLSMFEVVQLLLECCAFAGHKCKTGNEMKNRNKRRRRRRHNPENINGTVDRNGQIKSRDYNQKDSKHYQDLRDGYLGPHTYDYFGNNKENEFLY